MENINSKLVVVLGMHRSGTSAITRGLKVLGVELNDRHLMPPVEGNNTKGFFEDVDINALNIELLRVLGNDWQTLTPIDSHDVELFRSKGYILRAVELLRQKASVPLFGFKDPRVAKLLPFWEEVFKHCQNKVVYVVAIRNPLSVARSLVDRDGLKEEHSYILWLSYVLTSLRYCKDGVKVVVDYDRLMEKPERELGRIAKSASLDLDTAELEVYQSDFLESKLRHAFHTLDDLFKAKACPALVREVYSEILKIATDEASFDDVEFCKKLDKWVIELDNLVSVMQLADVYYFQNVASDQVVAKSGAKIAELELSLNDINAEFSSLNGAREEYTSVVSSLESKILERDSEISSTETSLSICERTVELLQGYVSEKDVRIDELEQNVLRKEELLQEYVSEKDIRIDELEQNVLRKDELLQRYVSERDVRIDELEQNVLRKEELVVGLEECVVGRDTHIVNFERIISEKESRIGVLEEENVDKNSIIQAQASTIDELYNSTSWHLTRPFRYIGTQFRKTKGVEKVARYLLKRGETKRTLAKKVFRVLLREGVKGLKTRVRQQYLLTMPHVVSLPFDSAPNQSSYSDVLPKFIVRDSLGHYSLSQKLGGYTYIEPQRPVDIEKRIKGLQFAPFFSIVVPVYNTSPELLKAVIDSVQSQWYHRWELILADDASPSEETCEVLKTISHPQIKLLRLKSNQGIAGATNAAIEASLGDFVVFMDHDDELTVDCLYELALCIEREQPDFIYSDEDKTSECGLYVEPHFKPDWSPDTMMSTMFTCHVSCVRRSLIETVGGLRSQYDGCQDWDFVLRVSEQTNKISHIPKVLYHWRIIPASIASNLAAKPYVLEASQKVRVDALVRRDIKGVVEPLPQMAGYFRVAYELNGKPLISIIIPTRDNEVVLRRCIDSILECTEYKYYELVVLDNGSKDVGTIAYLDQIQEKKVAIVVRHDAPFNFSELNNLGRKAASGDLLLFLNDDTEVLQRDWLQRLGGFAQLPHVGAVGAKLLYPGGANIQHAGILNLQDGPGHAFLKMDSDAPGYYMRNLLEYNWLAVTGACLMVEREKYDSIGGFSESLPVAYNDVDLCIRLHDAGYYNVVCQAVRLIHHESISRGVDHVDAEKLARLKRDLREMYEHNPSYFQHDPFHNPNLHPNGIHFEVPA